MSQKFKVGDKVRCIEGHQNELIEGEIYEIRAIDNDILYVKSDLRQANDGWYSHRFELVESQRSKEAKKKMKVLIENPRVALAIVKTAKKNGYSVCFNYAKDLSDSVENDKKPAYQMLLFNYSSNKTDIIGGLKGAYKEDSTIEEVLEAISIPKKPTRVDFKITKDYTATYERGDTFVQVGCQKVDLEDVKKLVQLIDECNKD